MDLEEAKKIIKALANGINPITGELLSDNSPYNEPDVIRALSKILESSKPVKKPKKTIEEKQQENITNCRPRNAGLPWTDELKIEVSSKFQAGVTIDELSNRFERTKGAIVSELKKQGLIEPGDGAAYL